MKKLSFAVILGVITISLTQAQSAGGTSTKNEKKTNPEVAQGSNYDPGAGNDVNTKALRDFLRSCKNAENSHWFVDSKGSCVYYSEKGKKGKRFYDKSGSFIYDILSYSEEDLPFAIRVQVKQTYYLDYNITHVQEIHANGKTIYMVQIQDKSTWKQLRICDEEMDVVNELKL